MPRITFDEFHVTIQVPSDLSESESTAMAGVLQQPAFSRRLAALVTRFLRQYPDLACVTVRVSR